MPSTKKGQKSKIGDLLNFDSLRLASLAMMTSIHSFFHLFIHLFLPLNICSFIHLFVFIYYDIDQSMMN